MRLAKYRYNTDWFDSFMDRNALGNFPNLYSWTKVLQESGTSISARVFSKQDDKNFILSIAFPGVKKEDFDITLENGLLVVGYTNDNKTTSGKFTHNDFTESWEIHRVVNTDNVVASYTDGVLDVCVTFPEGAQDSVKKISVK